MIADLRTLPFSRKGSWMVLSELNENWNGCGNEAGLYLGTVHSSAMTPLVARVIPETQGKPAEYSAEINRAALLLKSGENRTSGNHVSAEPAPGFISLATAEPIIMTAPTIFGTLSGSLSRKAENRSAETGSI